MSYNNRHRSTPSRNIDTLAKIISVGASLDIDITLTCTKSRLEFLGIQYENICKLEDFQPIFQDETITPELFPHITLSSKNFLINSLLYINKANRTKSFVEYLIPFQCKYSPNYEFMEPIVKDVIELNYIFLEEFNLLDIKPNIKFASIVKTMILKIKLNYPTAAI